MTRTLAIWALRVLRAALIPFASMTSITPRVCRFEPTCSAYAEQAIRTHGVIRGTAMAVRRLARCHPWTRGGHDPVRPLR